MALILFVDDEPLTLKLLSQAAEIVGHQAITSKTAAEALEMAAKYLPDLIMLDINLAGVDGRHVVKQLRSQTETVNIPIVFLSASVEMNTADLIHEAGADAYLEKPIRLQTLIEVIRRFTGKD
jgi:CheY-like chemotaxis protein